MNHLTDNITFAPKYDGTLPAEPAQWTDRLVLSAVVWLAKRTGKPILKLTESDYREAGLDPVAKANGSAYDLNISVFDALQHTITGWPGGKPGTGNFARPARELPWPKRIIVFSPHPDDDVISMGGTIARLVKQGHEVHIAYETSGNIAVGDEEVVRFMHFINGFNQLFGSRSDLDPEALVPRMYAEVKAEMRNRARQDHDNAPLTPAARHILTIKGLIRRGEARTACTYNGIPLSRVHFLDLPFYESGRIEKLPMTEADVSIVSRLLDSVRPHQIYVAADLADPHGTHRKCTDAVLAAVDEARQAGAHWLADCRIWMYRGAWAEWDIEDIDMCVPMSPEELRQKRMAILKHSSQMESAPFLGSDSRLFWQRAEERNRATAALYDALGLTAYEAMEAFARYRLPETSAADNR